MPPGDGLGGDPQGGRWCGHRWSGWRPLAECAAVSGNGLYRIRSGGRQSLLYIGQGALRSRLGSHLRKVHSAAALRTPQERVFAEATGPEFSYVTGHWETHQRLELETDLVAAHVLALGRVPPAQFIG